MSRELNRVRGQAMEIRRREGGLSRQKEEQMQRPWGGSRVVDVLEGERGGDR